MTISEVLETLRLKGIVSARQGAFIHTFVSSKPFSVHWELRSLLYLGILLTGSGLSIIIYENIDTIGHQAIIVIIALITIYGWFYTYKFSNPFSWEKVSHSNKFVAYTLLVTCTTFLVLEGYLQYQYKTFGNHYGLAVLIPTSIFFFFAYRYDHKGVLSMAITGLASWVGLTIAPLSILSKNDFTDLKLIITAVILGILLMVTGWFSNTKNLKVHFTFTYFFLGGNLAAIAALIGLFEHDSKAIYFMISAGLTAFFIFNARQTQSLIFVLMGIVLGYILITYAVFKILPENVFSALSIYYFLFSSMGVIFFLLNFKKFLGIQK